MRLHLRRRVVLVLLLAAGMLGIAGTAYAYWTSHGAGAGSARTGTLTAPTAVSATSPAGSSTVNVAWTASAGSPVPQGYYVVRTRLSDSSTSTLCGTPAAPVNGTSCTDSPVADGSYTYAVTAVYHSWTAASAPSSSVHVGKAAQLAFTTQPGGGPGGGAWSTQPAVTVQEASGATVTGSSAPVQLTLTTVTGGPGVLTCTSNPLNASSGVATFAGCAVDQPGTYRLTATSAGLTSAQSSTFTIAAGTASKLAFTTSPSTTTVSQLAFATQPVVAVQDAAGNTVSSTTSITLTLTTPNGATLACTTNPKAAVAGVATFAGCKVDKAGTYTLTAAASGLAPATSASFSITAGAANKLSFTTQPSTPTTSQVAFGTQPVVTVLDASGNPVTTATNSVSLSLTGAPAGVTLACTTNPTSAVSGVATFAGCKVDKAGTYTFSAAATGLTGATSTSFDITAGVPAKLAFTTQPSTPTTSQVAFATQPVVTVQDASGNTVTTATSSVTLGFASGPASATQSCTTNPKAAVSGVATFAGCKVDKAGTYTLSAAATGLTGATSTSMTITAGAATKLVFTDNAGAPTCSTGSAAVGNGGTFTTWVSLTDSSGNPVGAGSAISISVVRTSGPGTNPTSPSLTISSGSSITTGSTAGTIPNGNPVATVYTASATGWTSATCSVAR